MKFNLSIITCILFFKCTLLFGQNTDLPVFVHYTMNEPTIAFINLNNGELVSASSLNEGVFMTNLSEDKKYAYALTRHFVYKIEVSSGDILDEYKFMEVLPKKEGDLIDPNLNIYPYAITNEGVAVFSYNPSALDIIRKMKSLSAVDEEHDKKLKELENQSNEVAHLQFLSVANINDKKTKSLLVYNPLKEVHLNGYNTNTLGIISIENNLISIYNLNKGTEETFPFDFNKALSQYPDLNNPYYLAVYANDNVINLFLNSRGDNMLPSEPNYKVEIPLDKTKQPIYHKSQAELKNFAQKINSNKNWVLKQSKDKVEMPKAPDFGQPKKNTRKEIAIWQENMKKLQEKYQKELNEWTKSQTSEDNFGFDIYLDDEKLFTVNKTRSCLIYNDKFLLVKRKENVEMFDLETKQSLWLVDLDF